MALVYYGSVVNPVSLQSFTARRCLLAVGSTGNIDWIVEDVDDYMVQETMAAHGYIDVDVIPLRDGEFIMPGLIDTHTVRTYASNPSSRLVNGSSSMPLRFPILAGELWPIRPEFRLTSFHSGRNYELLDWLENITFPMESKFSDVDFARRTYASVVRRVIDSGTTTCCYFGTIHLEGTKILAETVNGYGQRAFVGKCNMDRNSPTHYIEPSVEASISATKALISHIKQLPSTPHTTEPLVQPILTPRFAITCTTPLLQSLGELAASDPSLRIQTHISENPSEVTFTMSLFPECSSYAGVYESCGLLRANTILAHAVHLSEEEIALIAKRKAGISHCPTSNFNLNSGIAPIGRCLDRGIKVGLGTDVSGGYSPSILNAIQNASIASKVIAMQHRADPGEAEFSNKQLSVATLLYLATLGGAEVCNLENSVGSFSVGKSFDALVVSVRNDASNNPAMWSDSAPSRRAEDMLEQFFFCGDDRNIARVFVQGKLIGGTAFTR
ncbi:Metallo-dependent hydrolase [Mycena epipterygia]|nr:Metallo-dependent hydrolase [Mycena epipterygia]